jgi:hypothetical protein
MQGCVCLEVMEHVLVVSEREKPKTQKHKRAVFVWGWEKSSFTW